MKRSDSALACLCLCAALATPAAGQEEQPRPRPLGKPIALGPVSLIAAPVEAAEWLSRHPSELAGARGTLRGFTLRFSAKETTGVSFLMDQTDPGRSDVSYLCGATPLNPFRAATLEPPGNSLRFGSLGSHRARDGRYLGGFVAKDSSLTVFFDLPAECVGTAQRLRLALKVDRKDHLVTLATSK